MERFLDECEQITRWRHHSAGRLLELSPSSIIIIIIIRIWSEFHLPTAGLLCWGLSRLGTADALCWGMWLGPREVGWPFLHRLPGGFWSYFSSGFGWAAVLEKRGIMGDWVFSTRSVPGLGHLGQRKKERKNFLSSGWQWVLAFSGATRVELCSFSSRKPANRFWGVATSKCGVSSMATTSGDRAKCHKWRESRQPSIPLFSLCTLG